MTVTLSRQANGPVRQVGMLTSEHDGTITVKLHGGKTVRLAEPTAMQYARLREAMRDVDRQLDDEFPVPPVPTIPDDTPAPDATLIVTQFQRDINARNNAREDAVRDPEKAPYARVVLRVIDELSDPHAAGITLEHLPVEAFSALVCLGLLEVWETPLGGLADPAPTTELDTVPETAVATPAPPESPPEATGPASPASEPS